MVKIGELNTEQCESIFKNIEYIVENTDDWDTDSIPEIEFDGRMYEFVELEYSTEYEDGGEDPDPAVRGGLAVFELSVW